MIDAEDLSAEEQQRRTIAEMRYIMRSNALSATNEPARIAIADARVNGVERDRGPTSRKQRRRYMPSHRDAPNVVGKVEDGAEEDQVLARHPQRFGDLLGVGGPARARTLQEGLQAQPKRVDSDPADSEQLPAAPRGRLQPSDVQERPDEHT